MLNGLLDKNMLMVSLLAVTTASCMAATPSLSESICIETDAGCFQVIQKGAELPASFSTQFSNVDRDSVSVNVYQGESTQISDNRLVGEFSIPIQASNPGDAQIQVTLSVDQKNQLTVIAQDLKTGEVKQFQGGLVK